jgi:hypothetical protein
MLPANKIEFVSVLNGLAAVKPGAKLTPEALDVWWSSFRDWSIEDFRSAAAQLAKSHEFFPNPYHFEQLRKAALPTPGEAFAQALEVARTMSWHERNPTSGDPAIDAAARACGGYRALAMSDESKVAFLEKRFAEHYETIADREDVRASVPRLAQTKRIGEVA